MATQSQPFKDAVVARLTGGTGQLAKIRKAVGLSEARELAVAT